MKGKLSNKNSDSNFLCFQFAVYTADHCRKHGDLLVVLTSNAAFCTVIWQKTLAPSGQTVLSSSLLREKSCAPFSTPRLLTVLQKSKERKNKA